LINFNKSRKVTTAVNELSLDIPVGSISAVLGKNGAGKSTTSKTSFLNTHFLVNILTGIIKPDSGTVTINKLDLKKDIDAIRQSLGVCPQVRVVNVLRLTCRKTYYLISSLQESI